MRGDSDRSEPSCRTSTTLPSFLIRALVITSCFARFGLTCRDDATRVSANRVYDHVRPSRDRAKELESRLAVVPPIIDLNEAVRIGERRNHRRKVHASRPEAL